MKYATGVMRACLCVGGSRQQRPEPPAVDQAQYQKQYETRLGSLWMPVIPMPDGRQFVSASDDDTTGPLPPAENRLAVAIEAGEQRFPTGRGVVQQ